MQRRSKNTTVILTLAFFIRESFYVKSLPERRKQHNYSTHTITNTHTHTMTTNNTQNSASSTLPIFGDDGNTSTKGGLSISRLYKKKILVIVSVLSLLVFQLKQKNFRTFFYLHEQKRDGDKKELQLLLDLPTHNDVAAAAVEAEVRRINTKETDADEVRKGTTVDSDEAKGEQNNVPVQNIEFRSVVDKQQCIFILATPGSGSSTMVNLLQNCIPGCQISGENHGAIQSLRGFYEQVVQTNDQPRLSKHSGETWKKYFKLLDVQEATKSLATTMLNPNKSQCWGFKEIRYGRNNQRLQLEQDIKFLSSLCPNPKIILHTKRNPVLEFNSTVLLGKPQQQEFSKLQHQTFDSYVEKEELASKPAKVFRHYLEDYLERNTSFQQLWDYLECSLPVNQTTVKIVSERKGHPIAQPIKAR